jgi:hypothetical protein
MGTQIRNKKRSILVGILAVTAALVVLSSAQAGDGYTISLTGFAVETDTSGQGGGVDQYIGEDPVDGLRGIGWSEESDIPCYFESHIRDINDGHKTATALYYNGCGGLNWGNDRLAQIDDDTDPHPQYYLRGIAICDNGESNHRLKGIRLYKAKVWKTKKEIDAIDGWNGASHTNCADWKPPVYCPQGTIAESAVLHTEHQTGLSGALSNSVRGISLLCMTVTWK